MLRGTSVSLAVGALIVLAACSSGGAADLPVEPSVAPAVEMSPAPTDTAAPSVAASAAASCAKSDEPGVPVAIKDFLFDPEMVEIAAGETVTFTNEDTAPHSAVLDDKSCSTKNLLKARSEGLVFNAPGTYPYFCGVHPGMKGTIKVR